MLTKINNLFSSSKIPAALLLLIIIVPMALGIGNTVNHEFYYGINELLSNSDVQDGIRHGIGLLGLVHAGVEAAIWGTVFGGPAGFAAGLIAGA